mmetsp:Transcript_17753/g.43418  ORF Transcript_17753/g.43418 Transcript_17753/m.43418 type:complete len:250 (-) Transcript_17753:1495-2244(-)
MGRLYQRDRIFGTSANAEEGEEGEEDRGDLMNIINEDGSSSERVLEEKSEETLEEETEIKSEDVIDDPDRRGELERLIFFDEEAVGRVTRKRRRRSGAGIESVTPTMTMEEHVAYLKNLNHDLEEFVPGEGEMLAVLRVVDSKQDWYDCIYRGPLRQRGDVMYHTLSYIAREGSPATNATVVFTNSTHIFDVKNGIHLMWRQSSRHMSHNYNHVKRVPRFLNTAYRLQRLTGKVPLEYTGTIFASNSQV